MKYTRSSMIPASLTIGNYLCDIIIYDWDINIFHFSLLSIAIRLSRSEEHHPSTVHAALFIGMKYSLIIEISETFLDTLRQAQLITAMYLKQFIWLLILYTDQA